MAVNIPVSQGLDRGKEVGIQRHRLSVYEFYAGTGNHTEVFPSNMRELVIANDSITDNLQVQVIGPASLNITFILLPYDIIDERLPEFTSIVITAVGAWRFYPRTGAIP